MEFVLLTYPEVEGAVFRWEPAPVKPPELIAAAIAAGLTKSEVEDSWLGTLEEDFWPGPSPMFRRGARALMGSNGTTVIEVR